MVEGTRPGSPAWAFGRDSRRCKASGIGGRNFLTSARCASIRRRPPARLLRAPGCRRRGHSDDTAIAFVSASPARPANAKPRRLMARVARTILISDSRSPAASKSAGRAAEAEAFIDASGRGASRSFAMLADPAKVPSARQAEDGSEFSVKAESDAAGLYPWSH